MDNTIEATNLEAWKSWSAGDRLQATRGILPFADWVDVIFNDGSQRNNAIAKNLDWTSGQEDAKKFIISWRPSGPAVARTTGPAPDIDKAQLEQLGDLSTASKALSAIITVATKDTNPKDAVGVKKVPFSTVPLAVFAEAGVSILSPVVAEVGLAMLEGGRKYGRHNYRVVGVRASVYYDAAMRHLFAQENGQTLDPDSGLPHHIKALASLVVLRDAMLNDKWVDDRPPRLSERGIVSLDAVDGEPLELAAFLLTGWWEGEDGALTQAIKYLADVCETALTGSDVSAFVAGLNKQAARIIETVKRDNPEKPYTQVDCALTNGEFA